MIHGDISNGNPPRFLVHHRFVRTLELGTESVKRGIFRTKVVQGPDTYTLNLVNLNRLWKFRDKIGCTLEVFAFDQSIYPLEDELESKYLNPFNFFTKYESLSDLVNGLPYRPDVDGVIDEPGAAMVYGSKFFDLARVGI